MRAKKAGSLSNSARSRKNIAK